MTTRPVLDYIHPFYVASDLPDLDAAFEDGKQRAISTLEKRIEAIRLATRADYEREFITAPRCGEQDGAG